MPGGFVSQASSVYLLHVTAKPQFSSRLCPGGDNSNQDTLTPSNFNANPTRAANQKGRRRTYPYRRSSCSYYCRW